MSRFAIGFLILITACVQAVAQERALPKDIFVLVDVSGSMTGTRYGIGHDKVMQAKTLVRDLLTDRFDWGNHGRWQYTLLSPEIQSITSQSANRIPLLERGSHLFLKRFGDPASSKTPALHRVISDPSRDVEELFASFPKANDFRDQRTFLWLARAKTRQEAIARGLTAYLLVEITDAREDKENIVDTDDQIAVREFKSLKHVPVNGEIGAFTHRDTQGEYVLQVNVRLVRLAGDTTPTGTGSAKLGNLQVPQGLREGGDAVISWDSFNATAGMEYEVTLTPPNGVPLVQRTPTARVSFPALQAGRHQVDVTTQDGNRLQGSFDVGNAQATSTDDPSALSEIILQSPRKDMVITSGSVSVSWRVVNPPPGCQYLVTVTGPPGAKIPKKTVDGTRASFSLRQSGAYRVRVAATARGVKPASVTFQVKSMAGKKALYTFLTLIPIAVIVGMAIRHARRRRQSGDDFDDYADGLD